MFVESYNPCSTSKHPEQFLPTMNIPHGMWELLDLFIRLFVNRLCLMNYKVDPFHKTLKLRGQISRKAHYFRLACMWCVTLHTLYCFGISARKLSTRELLESRNDDETRAIVRTYIQILVAFLPAAFLAMDYVLFCTPSVVPEILNGITLFQHETKGMLAVFALEKNSANYFTKNFF